MKKNLIFVLIPACIIGCSKTAPVNQPAETPVTKTIRFHVAQQQDYSLPQFDNVKAEAKLTILKRNKNEAEVILWDTTFVLSAIRSYPPYNNPLEIVKKFEGILPGKEEIIVAKSVKYVHNDAHITQSAFFESIDKNGLEYFMEVKL